MNLITWKRASIYEMAQLLSAITFSFTMDTKCWIPAFIFTVNSMKSRTTAPKIVIQFSEMIEHVCQSICFIHLFIPWLEKVLIYNALHTLFYYYWLRKSFI